MRLDISFANAVQSHVLDDIHWCVAEAVEIRGRQISHGRDCMREHGRPVGYQQLTEDAVLRINFDDGN